MTMIENAYPPSDCTVPELNALMRLGERFSWQGVICDLGCGNGGSTAAFAMGVSRQGHLAMPAPVIHAFDWFGHTDNPHAEIKTFKRNTAKWSELISVHSGDISIGVNNFENSVEILFVDVAKSLSAHKASMRFLPLLNDRWIFVNQDAGRPHLFWIQYSLDTIIAHSEKFEVVDDMVIVYGARELPDSIIDLLINDDFNASMRFEGIQEFYKRVGVFVARGGVYYRDLRYLTNCFYYLELGDIHAASLALENFDGRVPVVPENLAAVVKLARRRCEQLTS